VNKTPFNRSDNILTGLSTLQESNFWVWSFHFEPA
jgi:hypothetical protein